MGRGQSIVVKALATCLGLALVVSTAAWWADTQLAGPLGGPPPRPAPPFSASALAWPTPPEPRAMPPVPPLEGGTLAQAWWTPPARVALERYQQAASMRKFVLDTLDGKSTIGAPYYAARALQECRRVMSETDVLKRPQPPYDARQPDPDYARRVAAADFYRQRCQDFVPAEMDEMARRLQEKGRAQRDPLTLLADRLDAARSNKGSSEDLQRAMAEIALFGDPGLIDTAGMERLPPAGADASAEVAADAASQPGDGPPPQTFRYKGRTYSPGKDPAMFDALHLLPCGLGLSCNVLQGDIGLTCAAGEGCAPDRFEALKATVAPEDPRRYKEALNLYRQLVDSIENCTAEDFRG